VPLLVVWFLGCVLKINYVCVDCHLILKALFLFACTHLIMLFNCSLLMILFYVLYCFFPVFNFEYYSFSIQNSVIAAAIHFMVNGIFINGDVRTTGV